MSVYGLYLGWESAVKVLNLELISSFCMRLFLNPRGFISNPTLRTAHLADLNPDGMPRGCIRARAILWWIASWW
jgi:hypothetical protein